MNNKESTISGLKQELDRKIPSFERELAELSKELVRKDKEKTDYEKEIATLQVDLEECLNRERLLVKKQEKYD